MKMVRYLGLSLLSLLMMGCSIVEHQVAVEVGQLQQVGYQQYQMPLHEGGVLRYWQNGEIDESLPSIILLHGFGGDALSSWQQVMLSLCDDYNIIAPDLLWFGGSHSPVAANLASQTNAIKQLIASLELTSVNLIGISYGGFVTFDLMVSDPSIDRSILLASPGVLFSDADLTALSQRFDVTSPEAIFVPHDRHEMRRLLTGTFSDFPWYPSFVDQQIFQRYFADWADERQQLITSLPAHRDRLAMTLQPDFMPDSMLIWGSDDKIFPLKSGLDLAALLNAPIVVIPDAPHGISNEFPKIITQTVRAFIP